MIKQAGVNDSKIVAELAMLHGCSLYVFIGDYIVNDMFVEDEDGI